MAGQAKNTQSTKYQLTINHPEEKGMTHKRIIKTLQENFKTLEYFCMADEQGTIFHTHVFICFLSRVRFSTVKKHFPQAHIEPVKGTINNGHNLATISKMMGHSQTATTMHYLRDVMQDDNLEETFKNLGYQG